MNRSYSANDHPVAEPNNPPLQNHHSQLLSPQKTQSIGPYILQNVLGVGTTGKVKLAYHKETGQQVAIKIISKSSFEEKPNLQFKVRREIALMRAVKHPNILRLIDVLESQRHLCMVLEYAKNGELFDFLVSRRCLSEDLAIDIFRQIILAIEYLHFHGICHRDLKPENILLDQFNKIKIADFGFARWVKKNITDTSCGSPHYAAPEVIRGIPYDPKMADIWSLGVILYALLAGYLPFDDSSVRVVLHKVKKGVYEMPPFPADIADLISNLIVVQPSKRLTIEQIKSHRAFRRGLHPLYKCPTPIPDVAYKQEDMRISPEITKILLQIGFTDEQEIENELKSPERTMAKVFIAMLTAQLDLDLLPWDDLEDINNPPIIMYQNEEEEDEANQLATDPKIALNSSEVSINSDSKDQEIKLDVISDYNEENADPFHTHATRGNIRRRSSSDLNSPSSVVTRPQWVIETATPVSSVITTVEKNFFGMTIWSLMRKVQEAADDCGLQWFHPDPMTLYARTKDASFYVSINVIYKEMDEVIVSAKLHRGLTDQFDDFTGRLFQAIGEPFSTGL